MCNRGCSKLEIILTVNDQSQNRGTNEKGEKNSNIYARPSHQTSDCQDCGKTTSQSSHQSETGENCITLFFQGVPVSPLEILFWL